jgi:hypothetical protein
VTAHTGDTGDPADEPNLLREAVDTGGYWRCGARSADLRVVMSLSKPLNYSASFHITLDEDSWRLNELQLFAPPKYSVQGWFALLVFSV